MEGQELKNITVHIAGRPFPIKVKATEEPTIREIVKEVNNKIHHFQVTYTNKDKLDCLAMASLTYAVELQKQRILDSDGADITNKLDSIEQLLDRMLA